MTTTTRDQLGALAAGATIERCGGGSAMQRVMGRGHAASLVRLLWSDWVRPTLRFFVLEVDGIPSRHAQSRWRWWKEDTAAVSFAVSPLLLSVARSPAPAPVRPSWEHRTQWASSRLFVGVVPRHQHGTDCCVLGAVDAGTGAAAEALRSPPGHTVCEWQANSRWVAMVVRPTADPYASWAYFFDRGTRPMVLTVAPIPICGGNLGGGGDTKFIGGVKNNTQEHQQQSGVSVAMPGAHESFGYCLVQLFMDKRVESEVVVAITDQLSPENKTVIFVVDMEKTFNDRSLVLLSTTSCEFSAPFNRLVVMRNDWNPCSTETRSFLVKTAGRRSVSTHMFSHVDDVFVVSDSLLCVSFRTNKDWDFVKFYHTDDLTHPLNLLQNLPSHNNKAQAPHTSKSMRRFMAESGFIFQMSANMVDVIEPRSGFVLLTLNFPAFSPVTLVTPSSGFLH
ncbi:hypothetical protein Pelo_16768 [Pelomyxa schiedti]|nr:hypothetical protein Pelo_16768 [Pelomyxa schiedti]